MKAIISLEDFVRRMPKVELHLHLEGTLEPTMLFQLSRKNNVPLSYGSIDEVRAAYEFENLQEFLDVYYSGMSVLVHEQDFYDLSWQYLVRIHSEHVKHAEVFFDPQPHMERGVSFDTVVNGIHRAFQDGLCRFGITSKLIMCFVRHLPEDDAMRSLELALSHKDKIDGVGLDSTEWGNPPETFKNVFRRAKQEGFRVVAHAGEEGPPEYMESALDDLKVDRIDHGVRCIEDTELMDRLVKEKIPLTCCPISNVKLGVFPSMKQNNIKTLLDKGLHVTVNSDDPSYFGGYITDNFLALIREVGMTKNDVIQLAENAIEASFIDLSEKKKLQDELRMFVQENKVDC